MIEQRTTPREQLILRHISNSDGDYLIDAAGDNPRRWHSVVEDKVLTLTSVKAFVGRSFSQREMLVDADAGVSRDSPYSLTLTGVAQQDLNGAEMYGIDVSEGDAGQLIAQRVDENIGIDLISRPPQAFDEGGLQIPYTSEVFVSTDGWYYGDAESVQLLFDIPETDLQELYDALAGADAQSLDLSVSLQMWVPFWTNIQGAHAGRPEAPVICGYGGHARLTDWTATTRLI